MPTNPNEPVSPVTIDVKLTIKEAKRIEMALRALPYPMYEERVFNNMLADKLDALINALNEKTK